MATTFILSEESLNSYGFRVLTSGLVLDGFKANPVMLYLHDDTKVIGRWENIRVEGAQLKADAVFDSKDELANKIEQQVADGFIKGASLGFDPKEFSAEKQFVAEGQQRPTVTKAVVFEASICPLPGNMNAIALYNDKGQQVQLDEAGLIQLGLGALNEEKLPAINVEEVAPPIGASDVELEQLKTKAEAYDTLSRQVEEEKLAVAKKLVDDAIAQKKITERERPVYEKLAYENPTAAKSLFEKIHAPVLPMQHIHLSANGESNERAAWDFEAWNRNDPQGLLNMRNNEPENFQRILKAYLLKLQGKAA